MSIACRVSIRRGGQSRRVRDTVRRGIAAGVDSPAAVSLPRGAAPAARPAQTIVPQPRAGAPGQAQAAAGAAHWSVTYACIQDATSSQKLIEMCDWLSFDIFTISITH